jgi:hypothetical protein
MLLREYRVSYRREASGFRLQEGSGAALSCGANNELAKAEAASRHATGKGAACGDPPPEA